MGRHWVSVGLFLAVLAWVTIYVHRPEVPSQVTQYSSEVILGATNGRESRPVQAEMADPRPASPTPRPEPAIVYSPVVRVNPADVLATLTEARANRQRVIIEWADSATYRDPQTNTFSLSRYEARLAQFQHIDLTPFVVDGTLAGLLILDEPHKPELWGGAPVPLFDLEVAAVKSKALFPAVPIGVGAPPTFLEAGAPWTGLDLALARYPTGEVDVEAWLAQEVAAAGRADLVLGLRADFPNGINHRQ